MFVCRVVSSRRVLHIYYSIELYLRGKRSDTQLTRLGLRIQVLLLRASFIQAFSLGQEDRNIKYLYSNTCFRENKRWQQCQIIFLRAKENEVNISLTTVMNAILRPEDIVNINKRILQKKGGMFATKESKEAFMKGHFGRGVILIAISLIKRCWWLVLRTNCQRLKRERMRRNSFTDTMEDPS